MRMVFQIENIKEVNEMIIQEQQLLSQAYDVTLDQMRLRHARVLGEVEVHVRNMDLEAEAFARVYEEKIEPVPEPFECLVCLLQTNENVRCLTCRLKICTDCARRVDRCPYRCEGPPRFE